MHSTLHIWNERKIPPLSNSIWFDQARRLGFGVLWLAILAGYTGRMAGWLDGWIWIPLAFSLIAMIEVDIELSESTPPHVWVEYHWGESRTDEMREREREKEMFGYDWVTGWLYGLEYHDDLHLNWRKRKYAWGMNTDRERW
jgi:hypothetical protein